MPQPADSGNLLTRENLVTLFAKQIAKCLRSEMREMPRKIEGRPILAESSESPGCKVGNADHQNSTGSKQFTRSADCFPRVMDMLQ